MSKERKKLHRIRRQNSFYEPHGYGGMEVHIKHKHKEAKKSRRSRSEGTHLELQEESQHLCELTPMQNKRRKTEEMRTSQVPAVQPEIVDGVPRKRGARRSYRGRLDLKGAIDKGLLVPGDRLKLNLTKFMSSNTTCRVEADGKLHTEFPCKATFPSVSAWVKCFCDGKDGGRLDSVIVLRTCQSMKEINELYQKKINNE